MAEQDKQKNCTQFELDSLMEYLTQIKEDQQNLEKNIIIKKQNEYLINQEKFLILNEKLKFLIHLHKHNKKKLELKTLEYNQLKSPQDKIKQKQNDGDHEDVIKEDSKVVEQENDNLQPDEEDNKFKQNLLKHFNSYLQNETYKLNKFKDDNSNEFVANLAVFLNIRLLLPEIDFENIKNDIPLNIKFRLNNQTTFIELKNNACNFWQVNLLLNNKNENEKPNENRQIIFSLPKIIKDRNAQVKNSVQKKQFSNLNTVQIIESIIQEIKAESIKDKFSHFYLCDENFSDLPNNENVQDFFIQKGIKDFSTINLILKKKETRLKELLQNQDKSTLIAKPSFKQKTPLTIDKPEMERIDPYQEFFTQFPGFKYYINTNAKELEQTRQQKKRENMDKDRFQKYRIIDDQNCLVILFLTMLLIFSFLFQSTAIDPQIKYNITQAMKNKLHLQSGGKYWNIQTDDDLINYMNTTLAQTFFDAEYGDLPGLKESFITINPLRLRQLKMPYKDCNFYVQKSQQNSCFDIPTVWTDDILYKETLYDGQQPWMKFKTAQETGIHSKYISDKNLYTLYGQGYVYDFNEYLERTDYKNELKKLFGNDSKTQFLTDQTRAVFITISLYQNNLDIQVYINLILIKSIQSIYQPQQPQILVFKPNIFEGEYGQFIYALNIIRLVFTLCMLAFTTFQIFFNYDQKDKIIEYKLTFNGNYLKTYFGILNTLVIIFSSISIYKSFYQDSLKLYNQEIVNREVFLDIVDAALAYDQIFFYQSISIMCQFVRMVSLLRISNKLRLIVEAFEEAFQEIIIFFVIFIPIMIGFSIIFKIIWGPYISFFSTFQSSLYQVFQMVLGNFRTNAIFDINIEISYFYLIFFYIFIVFLIYSFFIGIMIVSYRKVISKSGYPSQQEAQWKIKDAAIWFFSWVPQRVIKKLEDFYATIFSGKPK